MNLDSLKFTAYVNGLSWVKIPLLAFISPRVVELTDTKTVVRVRKDWRTGNHVGVMYFGSLAMGAELSVALKAVQEIQASQDRIEFIFKDFKCEFSRMADGHVHFICEEADKVAALVHRTAASSERQEQTFKGFAIVPSQGTDPVMTYSLTLSMKNRTKSKAAKAAKEKATT